MSRSLAAEVGLLDVTSGTPASTLLADLGLPAAMVPQLLPDGTISGAVRDGAFAGMPVTLAGADTQCALAGAGALDPGAAAVVVGWSAPVQLVTATPVFDPQQRTWTGLHVTPDRWVLESNAGEAGRVYEWLCDMLGLAPPEADALAASSPPGARDVITVAGGRAMDASRMSAGVGALVFPVPIVLSSPSRADVVRSLLEALAFAVRANVQQLERVAGASIRTLALAGGMSGSQVFAQILADVLDGPLEVARSPQTTALGAAAIASPALGLHATTDDAVAMLAGGRRVVHHDALVAAVYDDGYARWDALAAQFEGAP